MRNEFEISKNTQGSNSYPVQSREVAVVMSDISIYQLRVIFIWHKDKKNIETKQQF